MYRFRRFFVGGYFFLIFGLAMAGSSSADSPSGLVKNNLDGSQTLTGHVPKEVKDGTASFQSHASRFISARLILPLQNQAQLKSLLQNLYNPQSPDYHQFLTPVQFARQFPSSSVATQVIQEYLNKQGITVTSNPKSSFVLDATGPSGAFERAFGLNINNYRKSDGTAFYAPDADPIIPTPRR